MILEDGFRSKHFSSIDEHDKTIIDNIFKVTEPGDNLYFLGDAFWKWDSKQVEQLMIDFKKHKINIFWIMGNHDKASWTKFSCTKWRGQIKDITINKQPLTLCHYPLLVYHRSHYSSILLYGHIHIGDSTYRRMEKDTIINNYLGKALNVNIDFHDYKPIEFEQVLEYVKDKPENFDIIKKGV